MKKIASIVFLAGLVMAIIVGSAAAAAVAFVGLFFVGRDSFAVNAMITMVPAIMRDPITGEEVPPFTRAEKAMFDYLRTKSNSVTFDAVRSGAISFDPISYYIRYAMFGLSGRQKILSESTQKQVGVCNLNNGVLGQYYNFCFDRIALRYALANTPNAAVQSIAGYSSVRGSMPAALGNGELIISSNRNTIVETTISDFTSQAAVTGGGEREYDGGILEKPRFFLEQLQVEIELNLALGQNMPNTVNTTPAVEVVLSGVQTRLKF